MLTFWFELSRRKRGALRKKNRENESVGRIKILDGTSLSKPVACEVKKEEKDEEEDEEKSSNGEKR